MKAKTNGYGDSVVATKYIYQRIHKILDYEDNDEGIMDLCRLFDELADNYKIDTGKLIEEEL